MAFMAERVLIEGEPACLHAVIGLLRLQFRASLAVRLVCLAILGIVSIEDDIVRIGVPPGRVVPPRGMGPVAGETHYLLNARNRPAHVGTIAFRMEFQRGIRTVDALLKGYE